MNRLTRAVHYLGRALEALQFAIANETPDVRDYWIDVARAHTDTALISLGAIEGGAK